MNNTVVGWDIGGAHLKAVLISEDLQVLKVWQTACPLWQGLDILALAVDGIIDPIDILPEGHAITMTGELADIFTDRVSGVLQISQLMVSKVGMPQFYAGPAGFVSSQDVHAHTVQIASANWLASAEFVAEQVESGLFIDLGSTTCDIAPLHGGKVQCQGYTDAERMSYEELVYTGVVRTPVMALGPRVSFAGKEYPLAAEHFATTADVYRLTGELLVEHDLAPTADGKGKAPPDSARRLARMICHDLRDANMEQWIELAHDFRQLQMDKLKHAIIRHCSRLGLDPKAPIIGAGVGSFLVRALALELGREYRDAATLVDASSPEHAQYAAVCFPAYAVARLFQRQQ